jgi:hypothetical protein
MLSYEKPVLIRLNETAVGDVHPLGPTIPPPITPPPITPTCAIGSSPSNGMVLTVCNTGMTAGMSCTQGHGVI